MRAVLLLLLLLLLLLQLLSHHQLRWMLRFQRGAHDAGKARGFRQLSRHRLPQHHGSGSG